MDAMGLERERKRREALFTEIELNNSLTWTDALADKIKTQLFSEIERNDSFPEILIIHGQRDKLAIESILSHDNFKHCIVVGYDDLPFHVPDRF